MPGDQNQLLLPPWNGPAILLVDLDAFFASVEQLDHPAWRGQPVIVGGDADAHGVVATCSYEARAYGVRSAMAAAFARELCPQAIWTRGHFDRYREISRTIMDILRSETPLVQQVSIDEAFMDVSPNKINTEHPVLIAQRIQKRVADLGVTCSIGVGTTKSVAKIASDYDKPQGLTAVYPGTERTFLDPLPIKVLSGVGASAQKKLHAFGIRTLRDLAQADPGVLQGVFGKNGEMMRQRALGGDVSPVETDSAVKSVSNETTFARDLEDRSDIEASIATLAAKVGRRLRRKHLKGCTVSLKVRLDDRTTHSAQTTLTAATDDELAFTPVVCQLLDEVWRPGLKVRLIGVGVSHFHSDQAQSQPIQESLFHDDDFADNAPAAESGPAPHIANGKKRRELLQATDALRERFGDDTIRFGFELRNQDNTTGSSSKHLSDYDK